MIRRFARAGAPAALAAVLGLSGTAACSGQATKPATDPKPTTDPKPATDPKPTTDPKPMTDLKDPKGTTPMPTTTPNTAQRWKVYDGTTLILDVSSVPGPILSTAAPPPGLRPVTHPFLSASAHSAIHEHRLREILVASKDLGDFIARLRAAGFEVREVPAP